MADTQPAKQAEPAQPPAPLLWTMQQTCTALACRPSWLYDQVEAGLFPVVRLGRQLRFRPADLAGYLETHSRPAKDIASPPPVPRRRRRRTAVPSSRPDRRT